MSSTAPHLFDGPEYVPERDNDRLLTQLERIKRVMSDGKWRTLNEIEAATGDPVASISAQLRHLRKETHSGHRVERRSRDGALYEYQLVIEVDPLARFRHLPIPEQIKIGFARYCWAHRDEFVKAEGRMVSWAERFQQCHGESLEGYIAECRRRFPTVSGT